MPLKTCLFWIVIISCHLYFFASYPSCDHFNSAFFYTHEIFITCFHFPLMFYLQPKPTEHHHNWPATPITYTALVFCNNYRSTNSVIQQYMLAVYFFEVTWRWRQQVPPKRLYQKNMMVYSTVFYSLTVVIITNNSYRTKVRDWVHKTG